MQLEKNFSYSMPCTDTFKSIEHTLKEKVNFSFSYRVSTFCAYFLSFLLIKSL